MTSTVTTKLWVEAGIFQRRPSAREPIQQILKYLLPRASDLRPGRGAGKVTPEIRNGSDKDTALAGNDGEYGDIKPLVDHLVRVLL